jgi:signal-transduction protein with cAMP-binding, CBS, and nucleotidyltransferase domain
MTIEGVFTRDPAICHREVSLRQVARVMREQEVGSVIVVDDDLRPIGVVTDRDIVVRGVAASLSPDDEVHHVMSHEPACVAQDADFVDAARQMAVRRCRRLPVVDGPTGKVVGIVTLDDLLFEAGDALEVIVRLLADERHEHARLADLLHLRQTA